MIITDNLGGGVREVCAPFIVVNENNIHFISIEMNHFDKKFS